MKRIYYDVSHPAGFASVRKLYDSVKARAITFKQVSKWLSSQEAYNLFKPARVNFPRPRIHVDGVDASWELDLVVMDHIFQADGRELSLSEDNDGYKYVLVVIDVFSKYVWARLCKTKQSQEISAAFDAILLEAAPRKPRSIRTDMGGEFQGTPFERIVRDLDVNHYWAYSDLKAVFVERAIKTIKARIRKYIDYTGKMRYVDVMDDVLKAYNSSIHSSTGMAPQNVTSYDRDAIEYYAYHHDTNPRPKPRDYSFEIGDPVVISKLRGKFRREYDAKYSHEIFRIKTRNKRSGVPVYILNEWDGSTIKGSFYEPELQKITLTTDRRYKIEKVLRKRGSNSLVKWLGWETKYATWIPTSEITRIRG